MGMPSRTVDIEVTNRCNALCTFCPRDKMPQLGQMSPATFDLALDRIIEYGEDLRLFFAGFGEPLLHPEIASFVAKAKQRGIFTGINTNGALLSAGLADALLDAGLDIITFNVASFGADYEELYNLEFGKTLANIRTFLAKNQAGACEVWGYIVKNDLNADSIKAVKKFWKDVGIRHFLVSEETNRGGALATGECFTHAGNAHYLTKARAYFETAGLKPVCPVPFSSIFIAQEGDYYLCCQDWQKKMPLGSLADYSFRQMDAIKRQKLACTNKVCAACNVDPVNIAAEALFKREHGELDAAGFDAAIQRIRDVYQPLVFDPS